MSLIQFYKSKNTNKKKELKPLLTKFHKEFKLPNKNLLLEYRYNKKYKGFVRISINENYIIQRF